MKVAVIGLGSVGEAVAHALATTDVVRRLALLNRTWEIAEAVARDLRQARAWSRRLHTSTGQLDDRQEIASSDLVVITAGGRLRGEQHREDAAIPSARLFAASGLTEALTELQKDGKLNKTTFLVVTNPVDLSVTWLQHRSGIPRERIIGLGTTIESARFSEHVGRRVRCDAHSAWVHVLGEHGPEFATSGNGRLEKLVGEAELQRAMKTARLRTIGDATAIRKLSESVGQSRAKRFRSEFEQHLSDHGESISEDRMRWMEENLAFQLAGGATRFAIGAAVVEVARALRDDRDRVMTVSALPPSILGLPAVAISLPYAIGRGGLGRCLLDVVPEELRAIAGSLEQKWTRMKEAMEQA